MNSSSSSSVQGSVLLNSAEEVAENYEDRICGRGRSGEKGPATKINGSKPHIMYHRHMLRYNHLVQTVRTTFPVVQTVPFTFPLGISHLHLWRSGDGFSVSVCTAGKKMASRIRKPCIIALQLQLCTARPRTRYSRIRPYPCTGTVGAGGC